MVHKIVVQRMNGGSNEHCAQGLLCPVLNLKAVTYGWDPLGQQIKVPEMKMLNSILIQGSWGRKNQRLKPLRILNHFRKQLR